MFGRTFYHQTIRKYVTLFGTLFNDVWITRGGDGTTTAKQAFKVPLAYGPKEKFLARVDSDPDLDKQFAIVLPRMGFEIIGYNYAADRKLPTINRFVTKSVTANTDFRRYQYNPVPYDIEFQLSIFVKNTEDGTQIIEQILPYFTPEWTTTVQLISDPQITMDIPIYLTGVTTEDVYEGSFEERRTLIHTLNFVLKGYLFGPTKKQGIIKLANINFYTATGFEDSLSNLANTEAIGDAVVRVTIEPGLLANDEPTSYNAKNVIQATANSMISGGVVAQVNIINPGYGYANAIVTFGVSPIANTATGITVINGDGVSSVTITSGGSGYVTAPSVTISAPDLDSVDANTIISTDNYGYVIIIDDPLVSNT
jgi:hypothetical protein